ncbi:hypothetical protein L798_08716 [Zootermopsis nevadensis]|uniref:Uncharacterized protein n=1 Tax=Zootermopsis nevadensis TaxID=136037 RepID=A0A067RS14_ZOONE|nr:hypothetical protein L798_08716 [Zootermopsis nevadensis]
MDAFFVLLTVGIFCHNRFVSDGSSNIWDATSCSFHRCLLPPSTRKCSIKPRARNCSRNLAPRLCKITDNIREKSMVQLGRARHSCLSVRVFLNLLQFLYRYRILYVFYHSYEIV